MNLSPEHIKPVYTRIALVLLGGFNLKKAAELLGISPQTIYRLWKTDEFRSYYRTLERQRDGIAIEDTAKVERIFQAHAEEAALHLVTLMESEQDGSRRKALADDILDRAGFGGKQRIDINANKPMRIVLEDTAAVETPRSLLEEKLSIEEADDEQFNADLVKLEEENDAVPSEG